MKAANACLAAVLLTSCLQGGAAASLRAAPEKASGKSAPKPADKVPAKATDVEAVSEKVAENIAKALSVNLTKPAANVSTSAEKGPVQHKKLDVGFQDFEKNLTEEVSAKLLRTATGTAWNSDMRAKFAKNVTDALKETFRVILKPVKQSIGKTWMALPKDEQKDEYVETLKKSFESVFQKSLQSVDSHLDLTLKRVQTYSESKTLSASELLEKSEVSVGDSLITEHCYEVDAKKSMKPMNKTGNASEIQADKKKFCIQSVIGALAHRLNDTQGLISMSMRFESGAMSLAQKKNKAH